MLYYMVRGLSASNEVVKTGSLTDLALYTMLNSNLTLSKQKWFVMNPVSSPLTKEGITFSNRRAVIYTNILYSDGNNKIGLYQDLSLVSIRLLYIRACAIVLGKYII